MKIMKLEVLGPHCMSHSATSGYSLYTDPDTKTERWGSIRKHKDFVHREANECEGAERSTSLRKGTGWGGGGRVQTPGSSQQLPAEAGSRYFSHRVDQPASPGGKKPVALPTV